MPRAKNKTEHDDVYVVYSASGFSSGGDCNGMLSFNGEEFQTPIIGQKAELRFMEMVL